jgi:hypothetical protein
MASEARYAIVRNARSRREVSAYLPEGYFVIGEGVSDGRTTYIIAGYDSQGWTLDAYVIPRLASGLIAAEEVSGEEARRSCVFPDPARVSATGQDLVTGIRDLQ